MRVTPSMYYKGLYANENNQLSNKLFDVNKQIASGIKIQYAHQDVSTFTDTMRLDNEITALGQIQKSTQSGYKFANQSDEILNQFDTSLTRIKTLVINASNDANDETSRDAIAAELRGIETNLKGLANTSINGQHIFSGSAVDIKPISDDGTYNGNNTAMKAFLGSNSQQQYNLTGADLFLGEEPLRRREVTTNVVQTNLTAKYPNFTDPTVKGTDAVIKPTDTIRDLMGDNDGNIDTVNAKHHFYINGVKSDGTAFNTKISMRDDEKIDNLLSHIGDAYGNTLGNNLVNVSLNDSGEIVVQDKIRGSSKLDFHMVGAVDYVNGGVAGSDTGDVNDAVYGASAGQINNLDSGEMSFDKMILGTTTAANPNLYVKEFVKSPYISASGGATNISGINYDRTMFSVSGNKLSSDVPQIVKSDNSFATPSTKLSEVADTTLDGKQLKFSGTNVNGTAFDVSIDLAAGGSTFTYSIDTTNNGIPDTTTGPYNIYNADSSRSVAKADDVTYQQLMDVMNMVTTNNIPAAPGAAADYDTAVETSKYNGTTALSYDGKIEFSDLSNLSTKATMSLYDTAGGDFSTATTSAMTFNTNNALTVTDPKTDFFKMVDEIISSVEDYKNYPDSNSGSPRNVGMENAMSVLDNLQNHVIRSHAQIGAYANTLNTSMERTATLEVTTKTLRSSVIDTDLAEASLTLTQLTTNYQAMLSTVGRVSKLSLVNYL